MILPIIVTMIILTIVSSCVFIIRKKKRSKQFPYEINHVTESDTATPDIDVHDNHKQVPEIEKHVLSSTAKNLPIKPLLKHTAPNRPKTKNEHRGSKHSSTEINRNLRKMSVIRNKPSQLNNCVTCDAVLETETVYVASYPVAHFKEVGKLNYVLADVFTCPNCRYICAEEQMISKVKVQAKAFWIDVRPWIATVNQPFNTKKNEEMQPTDKPFKWPTTYAVETLKPTNGVEGFKQESDLHKLGYRISPNLTRYKRWVILEQKALPNLGLEKVANTIAANVRQRKRQKGGAGKYANAIKEWEHDLAELKKHYYKWDFMWPHTY